jgi:hypothetical protein
MAENDSTAGSATHEELADVQAVLERIMSSGDDRTKKLIFNRVLCQMADALPKTELPSTLESEPIPAHTKNLIDAADKLREAASLAEFIQSISLNVPHGGTILLQPGQVTGFYYAMQNTIDRITEAEALIDTARKYPGALPA